MSRQFTIIQPNEKRHITACVGFVHLADQPEVFVAVKNKRGWDIPGGHVEDGETLDEAFSRELLEESGCLLQPDAKLIAILEVAENPAAGIAVYYGSCTIGSFAVTDEIEEIAFITSSNLHERYFGDKELLLELMALLP